MLSILIPSYNYNTFPLVQELHQQLLKEHIDFEIVVADDASTDTEIWKLNQNITTLSRCFFNVNTKNLGRGANRNALCKIAKYQWILFLDCDTIPTSSAFIKNYIDCIKQNEGSAFFGGIVYSEMQPSKDELLRWIYGRNREAIPLKKRLKKIYESTLISNILLKKQLLLDYPFNLSIYDYGYEDFVFVAELQKNNIPINHIENPVYHLNLEKSIVFLDKHLKAIDNLKLLVSQKIIAPRETSLSRIRVNIERFKIRPLVVFTFKVLEPLLRRNLISNKPSLFLFDLYKLGYFCSSKRS